jgi:hypothetical protein
MTDIVSIGGHTISTLLDKRADGIYGVAFCPICDKDEETRDQGNGQRAVAASIVKIRNHIRSRHRIQDGGFLQDNPAGCG